MKLTCKLITFLLCFFALAAQAQTFVRQTDKDITLPAAGRGICKKGNLLYVVSGNKNVYLYDLDTKSGRNLITGFTKGYDVDVAGDGTVYVACGTNVAVYRPDGTKDRDIAIGENVYGVTVGPDGKVYAASALKVTVIDGGSTQTVNTLAGAADKFRQVQKVCFDADGAMYICDFNTGVMKVASIDGETANIALRIKKEDGADAYNRLVYMTVLSNGHMLVSANRSSESILKVYDFRPDGSPEHTYEGSDITNPWGIMADEADNLYLVDGTTVKFYGYSDTAAPELTDVAISNITRSSVDFAFRSNEKGSLYWLIADAATAPSADRLLSAAKIDITEAGALITRTLDAPTATSLRLYYMAVDRAGNRTAVLSTDIFSTHAELALQYLVPVYKTAASTTVEFAANSAGKLYYTVTAASAAAPGADAILAGTAVDYTVPGQPLTFTIPAATAACTVHAILAAGSDKSAAVACTVAPYGDIDIIRDRYFGLLLGDTDTDYSDPAVASRYKSLLAAFGQAAAKAPQYDPDQPGLTAFDIDERNSPNDIVLVRELVGSVLFPLAMAYNLPGPADNPNPYCHNATTLAEILKLYRYLDVRNFRAGRELHFTGGGIYLRLTGYFYASMLMRTELQRAGMLDQVADMMGWATRWVVPGSLDIEGGESDWSAESAGNTSLSDGVRTIYNNRLMYLLTLADHAADRESRMAYLTTTLNSVFRPHDAWDGFLKPDYTGYHHNGPWGNAYSTNAMDVAAQMCYLLRSTAYAVDDTSAGHIARGLEAYARYSGKYDISRGLCGRFPNQLRNIPASIPAYAYMYETLPEGELRTTMGATLADLYDPDYSLVKSKLVNNVACEINFTAGMGSLTLCNEVKAATTAPASVDLNRTFPFAAMQIHRRADWLVTVKGCSKYVWDFETNGGENWYGRNQSFGQLSVYSGKDAEGVVTAEASGVGYQGYDWSHIPGVTAPALSLPEVLKDAQDFQWPRFSNEAFASGVTDGLNGAYGYRFSDRSKGQSESSWICRLTARKSYFFFDNIIVALASDIDNTKSSYDTHTTIIQNLLPSADTPVSVDGTPVTGLDYTADYTDAGSATITDIAGNSYYIADARGLHLQRATQTSRNDQNKADTRGDYFTAWINHGSNTADGQYEYAITVGGAATAGKPAYTVLRKDRTAHIVSFGTQRGIVIFEGNTATGDALVDRADEPCAVWVNETSDDEAILSVANPDLGYYPKGNTFGTFPVQCWSIAKDRQFAQSQVQPVEVTLRGKWALAAPSDKVELTGYDADTDVTTLRFSGINAESLTVGLRKSTTGISDITAGAPARLSVTPSVTDGPLRITLPDDGVRAVSITDLCGRTVKTVATAGAIVDTDISALPAGHYLVSAGASAARVIKR